MSNKIGSRVIFEEDKEYKTMLGEKPISIAKGDRGILTSTGDTYVLSGKGRGSFVLADSRDGDFNFGKVDTESVSKFIFSRLCAEYNLLEYLDENEIDDSDVIHSINFALDIIF